MKQHNGMRPLDIVVLLKITGMKEPWFLKDVADSLRISRSEVSESVQRSAMAGLLAADKKTVMRAALKEFLIHGIRYVFPQVPGTLTRGVPTAHSAKPLSDEIGGGDAFVWPHIDGAVRGQAITPLYPTVPDACLADERLYELLALVDALRVGRARERELAVKELEARLT
ncbi:MAG TPA: hypothetical protein PKH10_07595 [bacterium]|nr:hypothetical protein [bacterium]